MSEKKFLGLISIEGILLLVLGLCILILPKLTNLTFGVMLSSAFIVYGIYKFVTAIINRNFSKHFVCEMFLSLYITTIGILLLLVPRISLVWLIALTGVYFILESIMSTAFAIQIRNVFNFWQGKCLCGIVLFLAGLLIILGLPGITLWVVAILSGICFVIKGMSKIILYLSNKNNYNV